VSRAGKKKKKKRWTVQRLTMHRESGQSPWRRGEYLKERKPEALETGPADDDQRADYKKRQSNRKDAAQNQREQITKTERKLRQRDSTLEAEQRSAYTFTRLRRRHLSCIEWAPVREPGYQKKKI